MVAAVAAEERWIATEPPVDIPEFADRVRALIDADDVLWVLEADGRVVGTLGLHATRAAGVMSIGICILEEARGRGGGRLFTPLPPPRRDAALVAHHGAPARA